MAELYRTQVDYSPGVIEDFKALPSKKLRAIALESIASLVYGKLRGQPLGPGSVWPEGPPVELRKVYFDDPDRIQQTGRAGFRIVYRELNERDRLTGHRRIHVIAIGRRNAMHVYVTAQERLAAHLGQSAQQRSGEPGKQPGKDGPGAETGPPRTQPAADGAAQCAAKGFPTSPSVRAARPSGSVDPPRTDPGSGPTAQPPGAGR